MVLTLVNSSITPVTRGVLGVLISFPAVIPTTPEMHDAERDARGAFEWQQSVLAYVEFKMGESWRRLHRPGQRYNEVRQHWLDVFRTCATAFNSPDEKQIPKKPSQSVRLEAALRYANNRRG